ncbi:hypothetical protein [Streptomyces sp. NPDC050560]|uniref:hypothetical protein n=1 Tax=Streptomyces sp. NPDC050560 TaxID=3365630 RepID=UPI0037A9A39B
MPATPDEPDEATPEDRELISLALDLGAAAAMARDENLPPAMREAAAAYQEELTDEAKRRTGGA